MKTWTEVLHIPTPELRAKKKEDKAYELTIKNLKAEITTLHQSVEDHKQTARDLQHAIRRLLVKFPTLSSFIEEKYR